MKRFLIGQLGSYGDCLYATTVARQIKQDYPGCHLTWAIGSMYRSILDMNPYIDAVMEYPVGCREDIAEMWPRLKSEALLFKARGVFDEVFLTQVWPGNLKNFDGTIRASIFRGYNKPITVSVAPVIRLTDSEITNTREFVKHHNIDHMKNVILFETSPKSGQSFVTPEFAMKVAKMVVKASPDTCIILSSGDRIETGIPWIIDGSELSFRENAELTKYCTLLVGCSSGISWLSTSNWAKHLPKIQLLTEKTCMYASFYHDHKHFRLPYDDIIEMTECSEEWLYGCIVDFIDHGIVYARKYHNKIIPYNFRNYLGNTFTELVMKGKFVDASISMRYAAERWTTDIFFR